MRRKQLFSTYLGGLYNQFLYQYVTNEERMSILSMTMNTLSIGGVYICCGILWYPGDFIYESFIQLLSCSCSICMALLVEVLSSCIGMIGDDAKLSVVVLLAMFLLFEQ